MSSANRWSVLGYEVRAFSTSWNSACGKRSARRCPIETGKGDHRDPSNRHGLPKSPPGMVSQRLDRRVTGASEGETRWTDSARETPSSTY